MRGQWAVLRRGPWHPHRGWHAVGPSRCPNDAEPNLGGQPRDFILCFLPLRQKHTVCFLYLCVSLCISVYLCVSLCISVSVCVCVSVYLCICVSVHLCVCLFACVVAMGFVSWNLILWCLVSPLQNTVVFCSTPSVAGSGVSSVHSTPMTQCSTAAELAQAIAPAVSKTNACCLQLQFELMAPMPAERSTHLHSPPPSLPLFVCLCFPVCPCVYVCVCLSVCLPVSVSLRLSLSLCLSLSLSLPLSVCLSRPLHLCSAAMLWNPPP